MNIDEVDQLSLEELLASLLGADPSITTLAAPIHVRTGGNPFFIEEVAQHLIETGNLEGTRFRLRRGKCELLLSRR